MPNSIIIVGAGPNLGAAVARRFGREGLSVGLVARDERKLAALEADLAGQGITAAHAAADIRDADGLSAAIGLPDAAAGTGGGPGVLAAAGS
jgi:short-subunit dehydrogenase